MSVPDFQQLTDGIEGNIAAASKGAMDDVTPTAKEELREQALSAGLGSGVARAWRGAVYPVGGASITPAGYIWSNAPEIVDAFAKGAEIVPVAGSKYLAIPTDNVPRRPGRNAKRMTPFEVETAFNQDLFFKRGRNGHVLAFIHAIEAKNRRGWRQATAKRLAQGRAVQPILMFTLVPSVKLAKLLDLQEIAERWGRNYVAALKRQLEAA